LGLGNTNNIGDDESPSTNVFLDKYATAVTAGLNHTCALLTDGAVRCWGQNGNGQLGLGNTTQIGDDEGVPQSTSTSEALTATAISAGGFHACALLVCGSVRCWGYNLSGQLGIASNTTIGDNENPMTNVAATNETAISAGGYHTCALLAASGSVRCRGLNNDGQLGLGNTTLIGDNENPTATANLGAAAVSVSASERATCVR
jgi:alpha-tubulin suppressor-like RCC1 family protein